MRRIRQSLWAAASGVAFVAAAAVARGADGEADPNLYVRLAEKVVPGVVNISTTATLRQPPRQEWFWGWPGGGSWPPGPGPIREEDGFGWGAPQWPRPAPKVASLGTGFVIDPSGMIITNYHVVAQADEIRVTFTENPDEEPTPAKVVGRDADIDVALLRVDIKRKFDALKLGDSDSLKVGEYVAAVGNPFGQGHSLTHGIISAKGRPSPDLPLASFIQTDAPINPGNSGGPLVNLRGEVVGINTAIDARAQGIGFAIPVNLLKDVLPQLQTKGAVSRGYLGVQLGDLRPELARRFGMPAGVRGALVADVGPGSPAEKAGLKPFDVITAVNGKDVRGPTEIAARVASVPAGDGVALKLWRDGKSEEVRVKTAQRPGRPGPPAPEG